MKKLKEVGVKAVAAKLTFVWFVALMLADALDELREWAEENPARAFQASITVGIAVIIGISMSILFKGFYLP